MLNGRKIWISRAPQADFTIVMAVTDKSQGARGGISAFIVDKGTPGFEVARRIPMSGGVSVNRLLDRRRWLMASAAIGCAAAGPGGRRRHVQEVAVRPADRRRADQPVVARPCPIILPAHSPCRRLADLADDARHRPGALNDGSGSVSYSPYAEWTANTHFHPLPDVPTSAEAGLPGYIAFNRVAAAVHSKTPPPIVDRVVALFKTAGAEAETREFHARLSSEPIVSPPAEVRRYQVTEIERWKRLAAVANVELQ